MEAAVNNVTATVPPLAEPPESPRMAALRQRVATDGQDAADTFWSEIAGPGTPLIEAIPGDDRWALVTFLWRAQGPTENVAFASPLTRFQYRETQLHRRRVAGEGECTVAP